MKGQHIQHVTYPPDYPSGRVVLISGGVDSLLCGDMYPHAVLLFVDFGQAEVEQERMACYRLFGDRVVEATVRTRLNTTADGVFVPARNLMLATLAVHYGDRIVIGAMADDWSLDKTPEALLAMSRVLTDQAGRTITVEAPLIAHMKHEAAAEYLASGDRDVKSSRLLQTWSCYGPGPGPCADCKACFRRAVALLVNGIDVALPGNRIIREYLRKIQHYEEPRRWAILTAIRMVGHALNLIDLDGVLTQESEGTDYAVRTPNFEAIGKVNALAGYIIVWTSRSELDRAVTEEWLQNHKVHYDGLLMHKPRGTLLVDDLAVPCLM